MAVSGKTSKPDVSTPSPDFSVRSRCTSNSRAFPCNGGPWKADILLPWESTHHGLLGRDSTLSWISLLTDLVWTAFMSMPFFLIHWPPDWELLCTDSCFPCFPEEWRNSSFRTLIFVLHAKYGQGKADKQKRKLDSVVFFLCLASDSFGAAVSAQN